jgi:hypothetical protein
MRTNQCCRVVRASRLRSLRTVARSSCVIWSRSAPQRRREVATPKPIRQNLEILIHLNQRRTKTVRSPRLSVQTSSVLWVELRSC